MTDSLHQLTRHLGQIAGMDLGRLNRNTLSSLEQEFSRAFPREVKEFLLVFDTNKVDRLSLMIQAMAFVREQNDEKKAASEFFAGLLRTLGVHLKREPKSHRIYDADRLKQLSNWSPILRLVVMTRIKELSETKVLYRKGKYDLSGVKQTLYGKLVMETLGFGSRYVLEKPEYFKFSMKTKEMGFELPQETQPTEAEKYFEGV